jgi:hypothetical protein
MASLLKVVAVAALLLLEGGAVPISDAGPGAAAVSLAALPEAPAADAALRGSPMERLRKVEEIEAWEGQALQAHQHVLEVIMSQQVSLIAKEKKVIAKEHEQLSRLHRTGLLYTALGGLSEVLLFLRAHGAIQALGALTGIRAFLPIAVVALGSKVVESFPLHAGKELAPWLGSWDVVLALCALAALEAAADKVRGADEFMDGIMLIVKPAVAWFLAFAAVNPQAGAPLRGYEFAAAAALNAELVALVKMSITQHVAVATGGAKTFNRSLIEDAVVLFLIFQVLKFGLAGPCVVALSLMLFVSWMVAPLRIQAPWLAVLGGPPGAKAMSAQAMWLGGLKK